MANCPTCNQPLADVQDPQAYARGQGYAAESITNRGVYEVMQSIRFRFCSPGDIESASDFDRGVLDRMLMEVSNG